MRSLRLPDPSSFRLPRGAGISRTARCPATVRCLWKEDPANTKKFQGGVHCFSTSRAKLYSRMDFRWSLMIEKNLRLFILLA
ncbi:unnamed protein product [Victoria cruziana]